VYNYYSALKKLHLVCTKMNLISVRCLQCCGPLL